MPSWDRQQDVDRNHLLYVQVKEFVPEQVAIPVVVVVVSAALMVSSSLSKCLREAWTLLDCCGFHVSMLLSGICYGGFVNDLLRRVGFG
jgi:hypothetical protein